MTDLAWLTVAGAAELLRSKQLSPVEYAKALIARIERHDGKLNAFLRFTPEIALEDAKRAPLLWSALAQALRTRRARWLRSPRPRLSSRSSAHSRRPATRRRWSRDR